MRIRTAQHSIHLDDLRNFINYPLIMCKADPLAKDHVVALESLRVTWDTVYGLKLALDDKANEAQARVNIASVGLNQCASRVSKAILNITLDNRENSLYTAYFSGKNLSDFKRSFSAKLEAMRGWIPNLKASEHPSLVDLAKDVEQAVKTADEALAMRAEVKAEKRFFRNTGERKKLIEKTNVVCKSIHGELSKLPHEMPGLPADYADRFFLSLSHTEDEDEEMDDPVDAAKAKITSLEQELAAAKEHLGEVEAEKAKAAAVAAAREAEKAKLSALEAEIAEKAKLAAEIKAKLEKRPVV